MSARLTVAQALVRFLSVQEIERDGERSRFFAGALGIFGHGNVAGIGQALAQYPDALPFQQARSEQAMVHIAGGYARRRNRLATSDCTSSSGPGATNMVSGRVVIAVETDRYAGVAGDARWWDVPVAEVSAVPAVAAAREQYERGRVRQRPHLSQP